MQLSGVVRECIARATGGMDVDWLAQEEGDLGHRLSAVAVALDRRGAFPALIIGSDAPDLPIGHLQTALDLLRLPPPGSPDLVLGPTQDGGVWCIGLGAIPAAEVLREGIPWSTPQVQQSLGNRAHELGLKLMLAPPWYDVDEPADLKSLASRLRSGTSQATITTDWLRLRGLL